jgi:16S rRNA (guanine(966)-N(2))-methyltransferase RsmD
MRIIGGVFGGRRIQPPAHMPHTRPTTDIAKEGLFNILQNQLDFSDIRFLDLFGGTGCISYEVASRGASLIHIVEKDPKMATFIDQTKIKLGIDALQVIRSDVFSYIATCPYQYDLIFAGPPYALSSIDELPVRIFEKELLTQDGWFVLEHTPRNQYAQTPYFRAERKYGTTLFSFFKNEEKVPTIAT